MMKRISIALMTLAAALVAVSCQKEAELQEQFLGQMTITAVPEQVTTPDLTKAEMAYKYDVLWQTDDEILVRKESEKSTKATFKLKTGEGTTKGIFSCDESPFQPGDGVEAFYPASLVEESKLIWPAIQQNNEVAPMFCRKNITTDTEEFNFKSLGAVMQIVLSTPMKGITLKSISIKDGTKTMSGEFEVGSDGQAVITDTDLAGITLDLGEGVAIGEAAKYFNIAVPAGKYENLTLTFTATDGSKCVMTSTTLPEIKRNVVGKLTISAPQFTGGTSPTGALEGVFSVAEGRTVHFSQGNLWYGPLTEGAPATFNFETNQYDYTPSKDNAPWDPNHISHFFWSEEASVAYAETYSDPAAAADDVFFTNADETTANPDFTVNGERGKYRTLSEAEWVYLCDKRTVNGGTGKDKSYSLNVTYGGRMGLVLYPDNYDKEPISGTVTELPEGVVFLPASGSGSRTRIRDVGKSGTYHSSSTSRFGKTAAYNGVFFNSSSATPGEPDTGGRTPRSTASSVRLVTETINHLPYVAVESVTLDKSELTLAVGKTGTLSATIAPSNATNRKVIWTCDNASVAKIYSLHGYEYVEALAEGTATITAIVDATHTASCTVTVNPEGALPGKFSVSATKKVYFSKGNLYYDGSAFKFKFEANQYDSTPSSKGNWSTEHISHFYWSKDSNEAIKEYYDDDQALSDGDVFFTNADDFTVNVGGNEQGGWRTLSLEEWDYLFNSRSNTSTSSLYKPGVTVCGKQNCVVLLPDDWVWDASTVGTDWQSEYPETADDSHPVTWQEMQAAGAVCLPAAGFRSGSSVDVVGVCGDYWSSTTDDELSAYKMFIDSDDPILESDSRNSSYSVRLITDVK